MDRKVEIISTTRVYDGFFKLDEVRLRYEKHDGTMSDEASRLLFERGDSLGVLLYDQGRDMVLLVEQFRYPAYVRGGPGWLLEIVAGMTEPDVQDVEMARREILEETGYQIAGLTYLLSFYPSPGGTSERIHLYLGHLDEGCRVGPGGGIAGHEDIRLVEIPLSKALQMIESGEICDGKTIIALQHLALTQQSG